MCFQLLDACHSCWKIGLKDSIVGFSSTTLSCQVL
jgi:hypothetical protein